MSIKYNFALSLFTFFVLHISCSSGFSTSKEPNSTDTKKDPKSYRIEGSRIAPGINDDKKTTRQNPKNKKVTILYSGSTKTSFGTFNFRWSIDSEGTTQLTTLESSGSGELPAKEKKVFIQILNNGTTSLYQKWFPLVNQKKPVTLKYIANVPTSELFSAFPELKLPCEPIEPTSDKKIQSITWGKKYRQNNMQYLPSNITALSCKKNIAWEKKENQFPELIMYENSQTEKASSKLYIFMDESNNTSFLFGEKQLHSTQGNISYLSYVAKVKTDELTTGFKASL